MTVARVLDRISPVRNRILTLIRATVLALVMCSGLVGMVAHAAEVDAAGVVAPPNFADIVERVRPAVVGIRVKSDGRRSSDEAQAVRSPFPAGSPLDHLLKQLGIAPDYPAPRSDVSSGSGFFISGDGYIVTNNHVITGGGEIEVTTADGKVRPAKIIGADPQTDLALIKIDTQIDLPYVRLGKAEPRIGEWVLAIGNPFGLGGTVTAGIISAQGRDIGEGPYDFIQIDAPINEGNSGGPTFNVRGEVIGVNTLIYSPSGGSVGVAFDIPAETVGLIVQRLKEKGRVIRGWIGVDMQQVTPAIAVALGFKKAQGALVAQVEADGPAAKQGIEAGDLITSVNDREVKDPRELARIIADMAPDTPVKFGVFRNGQENGVLVRLGELPRTTSAKTVETVENEALGLTLAAAGAILPGYEKGVVVMEINPEGAAADSGLLADDIVFDVNHQAVSTPADVARIVDEVRANSRHAVLLHFRRGDASAFVAIPID
jgi:serine protease Do